MRIALFQPFERQRKLFLGDTLTLERTSDEDILRIQSRVLQKSIGRIHTSYFANVYDLQRTAAIDVRGLEQLATAAEHAPQAAPLFRMIAAMFLTFGSANPSARELIFLDTYKRKHGMRTLDEAFGVYCVAYQHDSAFDKFQRVRKELLGETIRLTYDPDVELVTIHTPGRPTYQEKMSASTYEALHALFPEEQMSMETLQQYCVSEHATTTVPFLTKLADMYWRQQPPYLRDADSDILEAYRDGNNLPSLHEAFALYCVECITPPE